MRTLIGAAPSRSLRQALELISAAIRWRQSFTKLGGAQNLKREDDIFRSVIFSQLVLSQGKRRCIFVFPFEEFPFGHPFVDRNFVRLFQPQDAHRLVLYLSQNESSVYAITTRLAHWFSNKCYLNWRWKLRIRSTCAVNTQFY